MDGVSGISRRRAAALGASVLVTGAVGFYFFYGSLVAAVIGDQCTREWSCLIEGSAVWWLVLSWLCITAAVWLWSRVLGYLAPVARRRSSQARSIGGWLVSAVLAAATLLLMAFAAIDAPDSAAGAFWALAGLCALAGGWAARGVG